MKAGQLDRFGSIDPTEGGKTDRENLNLQYTYAPSDQETWWFQLYGSRYSLRLYSDFTFYREAGRRFEQRPDGTFFDSCAGLQCLPVDPSANYIPGDGIDQDDQRLLFGARGRCTRFWAVGPVPVQSEVGLETRRDDADVALHRQVRRHLRSTTSPSGSSP